MKILLIMPPKRFWPYISEGDNYLLPQALPCLAAPLRADGFDVQIIDCAPRQIGWKSLAAEIARIQPDIIGVGENHALYSNESLRALRLAKETLPSAVTVAGGSHFTNLIDDTLANDFIDYIVRMEGEITLLELARALRDGRDPAAVEGLAFRRNGEIVRTPPRALIDDLDTLPMPAYDLMPMDLYGRSKFLFSPGGATIHHSRGCVSNCRFCAWWLQMADTVEKDGEITYRPRWRTKSVDRTVEEVQLLAGKYNKRCPVFVDEYWNRDPAWNSDFADKIIASGTKVEWFAFVRVDGLLRDEETGILDKLVRSGMAHISIGIERITRDDLKGMGKTFYSEDIARKCCELFHKKYPSVFLQGTFIIGVRNDTRETMRAIADYAKELRLDYPGFHPITPIPGTAFWNEARENGWIEIEDFTQYDWMTPIIATEFLTRREIEEMLIEINKRFIGPGWFLRGLFSKTKYRRNMYIWWFLVTLRILFDGLRRFVMPSRAGFTGLVEPKWYED